MKVILASGSPRRKELLGKLGVDFTVVVSTAEEIHEPSLGIGGLCEENARLKASAVAPNYPDCAVIGADTLVFIDGEPLGKPNSAEEAFGMLRRLSGRKHQVCTGVCIAGPGDRLIALHDVTDVHFRELDEATISEYLEKTSPLDKAGAYGIQDHGEMIVARIEGAFDNVMGLPLEKLGAALKEIGLLIGAR